MTFSQMAGLCSLLNVLSCLSPVLMLGFHSWPFNIGGLHILMQQIAPVQCPPARTMPFCSFFLILSSFRGENNGFPLVSGDFLTCIQHTRMGYRYTG